jgi:hypothetical protein
MVFSPRDKINPSSSSARVTARHNIQYAADDVSGVFELVSTDPETLFALQALYAGPFLRRSSRRFSRRIWKITPKHTKILKLYGESNVIFRKKRLSNG